MSDKLAGQMAGFIVTWGFYTAIASLHWGLPLGYGSIFWRFDIPKAMVP